MPGLLKDLHNKRLAAKLPKLADEVDDSDTFFESYGKIDVHRVMLQDEPRTQMYRQFIETNAASVFAGKVVLDLGSGTGILAFMCAKAGASRVFAVEPSPMANQLCAIVKANGLADVITVLSCAVEQVDPSTLGQVDVIISEWMGHYLLHESMLNSVIYARDNLLNSETGILVPSHARLMASPTTLKAEWDDKVGFWLSQPYGIDLSTLASDAIASLSSQPRLVQHDATELLSSEPCVLCDLNLYTVTPADLRRIETAHFLPIDTTRLATADTVPSSAVMRAVSIWFDVAFTSYHAASARSIADLYDDEWSQDQAVANSVQFLRTGPSDAPTHWKQTCIVWPKPLAVEDDQVIGFRLILSQEPGSRSYLIELEALDPSVERHPLPCRCGLPVCALVQAQSDEYDRRDLEVRDSQSMSDCL